MPRPTMDVNGAEYQEILKQRELYRLYKSDYPDVKWIHEVMERLEKKSPYGDYTDKDYADFKKAREIVDRVMVKYSPDQSRVPRGNPNGGQWTDDGASGSRGTSPSTEKLPSVNPAADGGESVGHRLRYPNPSPSMPKPPTDLSASPHGVNEIMSHEDFRSQTYLDSAGHPTIGYGHKLGPNESYPNGVTQEEAQQLLDADVRRAENSVRQDVKVPLTQPQFDALASFAYNVKPKDFRDSTLLRLINQGDYNGAADQFPAWNKVTQNGVKVPSRGLTNRRRAERDLFLSGTH